MLMARLFEDDKFRLDHQHAGIVLADQVLHVFAVAEDMSGHLVEGNLLVDDLLRGVIKGLEHIDLLFELGDEFPDHFFRNLHYDSETVDVRLGRLAGGEALYIDVAAAENGNHP